MPIIPITDSQIFNHEAARENAARFVNASNNDVSKMASQAYDSLYKENDKNFNKATNGLLNSVPVLAVAAGLASKKSVKSSLVDGAGWGIALAAPKVVSKLNKKTTEASPKLKRTEKKHPVAAFAGEAAASIGVFFGMNALFNKAAASPKVKNAVNNAAAKVKDVFGNIKSPIQFTPEASKGLEDLKSKIKVPEFVKSAAENIKNSKTMSRLAHTTAEYGKKLVKNAPIFAVFGTAAAVVEKTLSTGSKYSDIKHDIQNSQLTTARKVIKSYENENGALKSELYSIKNSKGYS